MAVVLAHKSRQARGGGDQRQTQLLMHEIEAHRAHRRRAAEAKEAAEAANLAKSRYVVGLSHELRTPLNTISAMRSCSTRTTPAPTPRDADPRDQARRRAPVGPDRRHARHRQDRSRRLYAERATRFRSPNSCSSWSACSSLQAAAKGIDFPFRASRPTCRRGRADEKRLRQVLINLLSNAIKFTAAGKRQVPRALPQPGGRVRGQDTGPGIPPDDLERIFEPFERGALGARSRTPGTGLGLTISKLLTERDGRRHQARPRPVGTGSAFA